MGSGTRMVDKVKLVGGLSPIVPSSSTPDYVNVGLYNHLTIVISVKNATTVTGSAITLLQATDAAAAGEKALAFDKVFANADVGAGEVLTETAVVSNTFTTGAVNNKEMMYVIEIDAATLDTANGFKYVRAGVANATAATVSVLYILSGARIGGALTSFPAATA